MVCQMGQTRLPRINQSNIIYILNHLFDALLGADGFRFDNEGICAGLVVLYLVYKAQKKEHEFFDMLKEIASLKKSDYEKIKQIFNHQNNNSPKNIFDQSNESYLDKIKRIAHFCQKLQFAFAPTQYRNYISQGDIDKILEASHLGINAENVYKLGVYLPLNDFINLSKSASY